MSGCDLSIITATCNRHAQLWQTIQSVKSQSAGSLKIEHIVVSDGPDSIAKQMCKTAGVRFQELNETHGAFGAFAKDKGVELATGEYVAFWDDDNHYATHAAASLFASAVNFDIGIVRTSHRCRKSGKFVAIPREWADRFLFQDIDTMCVCVRRELALNEKWGTENQSRGTDYRWLKRISKGDVSMNFVTIEIGTHC